MILCHFCELVLSCRFFLLTPLIHHIWTPVSSLRIHLVLITLYRHSTCIGDKVSLSRVGWVEGAGCHQHSLVDPLPGIHRLTPHSAPGGPIST